MSKRNRDVGVLPLKDPSQKYLGTQAAPNRLYLAHAYEIAIDRHHQCCVADSGANISVTNPATVHALGLPTQPCTKPFRIIFANASSTMCAHYANLGSIISKVAIVDTAPYHDDALSSSRLGIITLRCRQRHWPMSSKTGISGKFFLQIA
jgi:hypothetical protein